MIKKHDIQRELKTTQNYILVINWTGIRFIL